MVVAPLLETPQSLIPNHSAHLLSVLSGVAGVLSAALLTALITRA